MECIWVPGTWKGYNFAYRFHVRALIYGKFEAILCIAAYNRWLYVVKWTVVYTVKRPESASGYVESCNNTVNAEVNFFSGSMCMQICLCCFSTLIYCDFLWLPQVIVIVYAPIWRCEFKVSIIQVRCVQIRCFFPLMNATFSMLYPRRELSWVLMVKHHYSFDSVLWHFYTRKPKITIFPT